MLKRAGVVRLLAIVAGRRKKMRDTRSSAHLTLEHLQIRSSPAIPVRIRPLSVTHAAHDPKKLELFISSSCDRERASRNYFTRNYFEIQHKLMIVEIGTPPG